MSNVNDIRSRANRINNMASALADVNKEESTNLKDKLICRVSRDEVSSEPPTKRVQMYPLSFLGRQMSVYAILFIKFNPCVIEGVINDSKFESGDVVMSSELFSGYNGPATLLRDKSYDGYTLYKRDVNSKYVNVPSNGNESYYIGTQVDAKNTKVLKETLDYKVDVYYFENYKTI